MRCITAQGNGLMFVIVCAGMGPMLLDTQYRMHPLIAEFPSTRFYSGLLRSGISAQDRPLAKGQPLTPTSFCQSCLGCAGRCCHRKRMAFPNS